ncbi:hypothetical protein CDAR_262641 [Caerostris darwini]|uniref:Serine hydrolase domain-containing protein n=1 Tax=Caerostris darwini TaxID=1538125 RepID=A0AAV4TF25_9ARAC|nr:hypothetical protein CDAR_262641 [Caerostris darwini]
MAVNRKLKILCLHGYRQDADSFKDKIGGFKKSIKNIAELVFINAPHEITTEFCMTDNVEDGATIPKKGRSWWFCDDSNDFNSRTKCDEAQGFQKSLDVVNEAFKSQGPFDGILGFSQGGALAALICALKENQEFVHDFYFVVIIAGFRSIAKCHQHLFSETLNSKSLHIIGEKDSCISKEVKN